MNTTNPLTSSLRDLWSRATSPSSTPSGATQTGPGAGAGATRSASDIDAAYNDALDRLPSPSVALSAVVARMDPVATRLDQLQAAMSGPYNVNGTTVHSGAQFRMNGGYNQGSVDSSGQDHRTLLRVAERAGLTSALPALQVGRGSPAALVKLTQALIDDDQLRSGGTKPLADQVHDLQWRFGIGVDCAGYVHQALAAIHGDAAKLGLKAAGFEDFTELPGNSRFAKVDPTEVRAGDVLVLKGSGAGDPGHNLIVRSHATLADGASLTRKWPQAAGFLGGKTGVQQFEVDSSFGAGRGGDPHGGVRRDVLLYDGASNTWCTCKETTPRSVLEARVPYMEQALTGFFRVKGAQ